MRPTIALAMIVRDEEAVIARCLESVRGLIDSWVICDTGSADRTMEIVRETLSGVPGELHGREWVNFGHNRSELLRLAHRTADYLLLLDADMTISLHGQPALEADAYMLRIDESPEYWLKCLVRGDVNWRSEGSTHEYLTTDQEHTVENLSEIVVRHHHDGSSRPQKLQRDRALLYEDLRRAPRDPRTVFYLAQTHKAPRRERASDRAVRAPCRDGRLGGGSVLCATAGGRAARRSRRMARGDVAPDSCLGAAPRALRAAV